MEPKAANVAKAEALLFGDGGASNEAAAVAPAVHKQVQQTEEERDAKELLDGTSRVTRVVRPARGADKERDVLGRFMPDGTPKPKVSAKAKEASHGAPAEKAADASTDAGDVEPEAEGGVPAPKDAKEPTRAEKARAQLEKLRTERRAREEKAKARGEREQTNAEAQRMREEAAREREAVAQERARWEAARKDPVAGFKELGLDASQAFLELAKAAKEAGTPEARADALEQLLVQVRKESDTRVRALEERIEAQSVAAQRAQVEGEFLAEAKPETYPYAHAYLESEAARQGIAPRALWLRAADHVADKNRAEGKTPSYKSIASEIEEYAKELALGILAKLPPDPGSAKTEPAARGKPQDAPSSAPSEPRGKSSTTIGNDLASTRASNAKRRLSMKERQEKAARLLGE